MPKTNEELLNENSALKQELSLQLAKEKNFEQIVQKANDAIMVVRKGVIIYVNKYLTTITGYSNEELIGSAFLNYVEEKTRKSILDFYKGIFIDNLDDKHYESGIILKNGSILPVEVSTSVIKFDGESAILTIMRDVSEKEQKNLVLKQSEEKFRLITSTAKDAIILMNELGTVTLWNKAAEQIFGYSYKEAVGKKVHELITSNQQQKQFHKGFEKFKKSGTGPMLKTTVLTGIRKDGKKIPVEIATSAFKINNQNHSAAVIRDISELTSYKNNLETIVNERTRELEESLEREKELGILKTSFVSMASHEFRTPLASINAATDVVLRYSEKLSKDHIEKRLYKIKNEVSSMAAMLEDILIIGKADSQKLKFNPKNIDIVKDVKIIIEQFQLTQLEPREIVWECSNDSILSYIDPKWLKNIVDNLFTNALKFSEPSSKVKIGIKQENNTIILSVSDQGIGIAQKDQKKLFEPFHRGENVNQISGTGLGLAIVQKAVELHKGEIFVTSELNKGTTFQIVLPINK